jgi:hypothetical protein
MTEVAASRTEHPARPRFTSRSSAALLLVALPFFLFTGMPDAAWLVAAGIWAVGVAIHFAVRAAAAHTSPNAAMGLVAGAMFVRMGVAMAALLLVGGQSTVDGTTFGMGEPDVAIIALILYTIVFTLDTAERLAVDSSTNRSISTTAATAARSEEGI